MNARSGGSFGARVLLLHLSLLLPFAPGPGSVGLRAGILVDLGRHISPSAISGDGSTVVGWSNNFSGSLQGRLFRWTPTVGMQRLPAGSSLEFPGIPKTSRDGSVVAWSGSGSYDSYLLRWTAANGLEDLDWPRGGPISLFLNAHALSSDGGSLVGQAFFSHLIRSIPIRGFRWTRATGFQPVDGLRLAGAVSANGDTIVGLSTNVLDGIGWWSQTGGYRAIGLPPGLKPEAIDFILPTFALTPDAATLFVAASAWEPVSQSSLLARWHASSATWERLDTSPLPATFSISGTSADGSRAVGSQSAAPPSDAATRGWLWTEPTGFSDLRTFLKEHRINISGWRFTHATGISEDGRTLIGSGVTVDDSGVANSHGWIAILDDALEGPPFQPVPLQFTTGKVVHQFLAQLGHTYLLQRSPDGTTWFPADKAFVGNGRTQQVVLPLAVYPDPTDRYRHLESDPDEPQPPGRPAELFTCPIPTGMSADGRVLACLIPEGAGSRVSRYLPGRWTLAGNYVVLPDLLDGRFDFRGASLSADGNALGGPADSRSFSSIGGGPRLFLWSAAHGTVPATPVGTQFNFTSTVLSADGSTLAGTLQPEGCCPPPDPMAFRWTSERGLVEIPQLLGVFDLSADGTILVGLARGTQRLGRFHLNTGFRMLEPLPGDLADSPSPVLDARMTPDAATLLVTSGGTVARLHRWRESSGAWETLADLPSPTNAALAGITSNGDTILGRALWLWRETSGIQSVREFLQNAGINFADWDNNRWSLDSARALSADGRVLAGTATAPPSPFNPFAGLSTFGWIAYLDGAPVSSNVVVPRVLPALAVRYTTRIENRYRLQHSTNLVDWLDLQPERTGDGSVIEFQQPAEASPAEFVRILETP